MICRILLTCALLLRNYRAERRWTILGAGGAGGMRRRAIAVARLGARPKGRWKGWLTARHRDRRATRCAAHQGRAIGTPATLSAVIAGRPGAGPESPRQ